MPSKRHKGTGKRKTGRTVLYIGLGAGLVLLAYKASGTISRLNETQADITLETSGRIHKVDLSGIVLAVDVKIKNPTRSALTFRHPFVKLKYKDQELLSSELNKEVYKIASYEEKPFTIYFKTSFPSVAMMAPDLYKSYLASGKLILTLYTKTEIYEVAEIILKQPMVYDKTEQMSFGKGSPQTPTA